MFRVFAFSVVLLALSACAGRKDPGALEGTWTATVPFPVTVTFRDGALETRGATKHVSYDAQGDVVLVTYEEGPLQGQTFRYTVIDDDTIRSRSGTFHRVAARP